MERSAEDATYGVRDASCDGGREMWRGSLVVSAVRVSRCKNDEANAINAMFDNQSQSG
jgi:hypothetical protein